ncbi:MAG: helix-turn-helix transcriptional regulator [Bacteroidetes bacterium]|nr:helix-turn-helix transcriptional regulator [Bacteroidota bacterium]
MKVAEFVKEKRKVLKLTQPELASKAGVGLRFVRELEQGKNSLRMDKVNQVLQLFGFELGPVVRPKQNYVLHAEQGLFKITPGSVDMSVTKKSK